MIFQIRQKCSVWIETNIEAKTLDEALEKAQHQMRYNGDFEEIFDTWDFSGEFWATDEEGNELELSEDWK